MRDFAENDIAILEFVRCFRSAGMSIERLIEYMGLVQAGNSTVEADRFTKRRAGRIAVTIGGN